MMRFFRQFKDLEVEGAKANYYDKICREHRMGEIKEEANEVAKWKFDCLFGGLNT